MTEIPIGNPGKASGSYEEFTQHDFLLSDTPTAFTSIMEAAENQTITLYQVVALDGQGRIIVATNPTEPAIGIAAMSVTTEAGETPSIPVIRGGHINGDKVVWHTAYNSDALKRSAFAKADSPTQILIDFNKYNRRT